MIIIIYFKLNMTLKLSEDKCTVCFEKAHIQWNVLLRDIWKK